MAAAASQPAVTGNKQPFALYLVLHCAEPGRAHEIARACAALPALARALGKPAAAAGLQWAISFGVAFWENVATGLRPRELKAFHDIQGTGGHAPATGGDVFLHLKASRPDVNLELARRVLHPIRGWVRVQEEVHGFRHQDWRDMTGFMDGTANPSGKARADAALIGPEDPDFAGGSYVLTQRYVHDLERWSHVAVREQEAIIGRTKRDSRELAQAPASAHIRRAELHVNGREQPIYRQSLPYGTASGEAGLYFVAYARDTSRFLGMLHAIMGAPGEPTHDRLMEFTRPVSGALFFAPSLKGLKALG